MPQETPASTIYAHSAAVLRSPTVALLLVMLAAALWATVGVASRLFPDDISVSDEAYGFIRTAVAGPVLLALWALCSGSGRAWPRARSLPCFLLFGVSCAIFQIGLFRSFNLLGVTLTVFITVCLPPVIAVLWSLCRVPAAITRGVLMALMMALAGLLAVSRAGFSDSHSSNVYEGLALSVMASVAFVAMTTAARRLATEHPPLLVAGVGLSVTSGIMAAAVFAVSPEAWQPLAQALGQWKTGGFLLYLGLVPTALAYLLYCAGMARCRTAAGGLVASMIEPAVAAGLALLFLKEWLSFWELTGCLMLVGAMLVLWQEEQRLRAAPAPLPAGE